MEPCFTSIKRTRMRNSTRKSKVANITGKKRKKMTNTTLSRGKTKKGALEKRVKPVKFTTVNSGKKLSKNANIDNLISFTKFCVKHPLVDFWQALRSWSLAEK